MNSPQAHLRLQKDRETRLAHARRRSFDETIFVPLKTAHLWLCAADKSKACHLTAALTDGATVAAHKLEEKAQDETSIIWFIFHKDNPTEQIGSIWLFQFSSLDAKIASAMLGYILSPSAWGKGYMSEALGAVIAFAYETLGLQKIEAGEVKLFGSSNIRSALPRVGYVPQRLNLERSFILSVREFLAMRSRANTVEAGAMDDRKAKIITRIPEGHGDVCVLVVQGL